MKGRADQADGRRGATLVLTALMLTVILGFVALAVDTTVLAVARHQLGIAADAGALAGASALADERRLNPNTQLDVIFTSAQDRTREFVEQNKVLGQTPVIVSNSANAPEGDVVIGYLEEPTDPASPFLTSASLAPNYNSVQVRAARSPDRGGMVPAFFSRVLGFEGATVSVTGTATALNYTIAGFTSETSQNADLLPFALHKDTYHDMINRNLIADNFRYDPATKQVLNGSDGIMEASMFPIRTSSGNWGTVNVGVFNNSTRTLREQIRYGITPDQLKAIPGGEIALNQTDAQGNKYMMLGGNPGISAGMERALLDILGQPRTIPIYDPDGSGGPGNNMEYKVIGFASVRVVGVNFQGSNKHVIVQPALTRDPTAIPGEVQSDWSAGGLIRLNLTR